GADPRLVAERQDLGLEVRVAEGAAVLVARRRERVEVAAARELHRLQRELRRGAADDERQVVGGAGRGAERADLLRDEAQQRLRVEQRLRLLVEEALVRGAASLRDEEQLVLGTRLAVDLDLRRQVRAGVLLGVHVD